MREDYGFQLIGLHSFFNGDTGDDNQFGGRISQEMGADDRFVFVQNQLAHSVALLVFGNKTAGERHRYLLDGVRGSFGLQFLFGLADTRDFGVGIDNAPEWLYSSSRPVCLGYGVWQLPLPGKPYVPAGKNR